MGHVSRPAQRATRREHGGDDNDDNYDGDDNNGSGPSRRACGNVNMNLVATPRNSCR